MHDLQPVDGDRFVARATDVSPDLHHIVGSDAQQMIVERGMTKFAQRGVVGQIGVARGSPSGMTWAGSTGMDSAGGTSRSARGSSNLPEHLESSAALAAALWPRRRERRCCLQTLTLKLRAKGA